MAKKVIQKHDLMNELAIEFIDYSLTPDFLLYMINRNFPDLTMIRSELLEVILPDGELPDIEDFDDFYRASRGLMFNDEEIVKIIDIAQNLKVAYGLMKLQSKKSMINNSKGLDSHTFLDLNDVCFTHSLSVQEMNSRDELENSDKQNTHIVYDDNDHIDIELPRNLQEMSKILIALRDRRSDIISELRNVNHDFAYIDTRKHPNRKSFLAKHKAELRRELEKISARLRLIFNRYEFPERIVDLHYLTIPEVKELLPVALTTIHNHNKSSCRSKGLVSIKIITGHNNNQSLIRKWTEDYLKNKLFSYRAEGNGAFLIDLKSSKIYEF